MSQEITTLENAGRRKAVKTIVSGVAAIAAYNILPSKWGTPIIEQVFLPAHAATSGDVPDPVPDPPVVPDPPPVATLSIQIDNRMDIPLTIAIEGEEPGPIASLTVGHLTVPDGIDRVGLVIIGEVADWYLDGVYAYTGTVYNIFNVQVDHIVTAVRQGIDPFP